MVTLFKRVIVKIKQKNERKMLITSLDSYQASEIIIIALPQMAKR